jgi:hypothetical protein
MTAPASKERHPWSHDDVGLCADMGRDGFTIKAIATKLQRSPTGIHDQLRKLGIGTSRKNLTREICLSIRKDALEILRREARARGMTPNTLCRLALELCALDKEGWLARLLSEDACERRHPALQLTEDPRPLLHSPAVAVSAPEAESVRLPPAQLSMVAFAPLLTGRM